MTDPGHIDRPDWGSIPLHDAIDQATARAGEFHCTLCALEAVHGPHVPATMMDIIRSEVDFAALRRVKPLVESDPAVCERLAALIGFGVLVGQALRRPDEEASR